MVFFFRSFGKHQFISTSSRKSLTTTKHAYITLLSVMYLDVWYAVYTVYTRTDFLFYNVSVNTSKLNMVGCCHLALFDFQLHLTPFTRTAHRYFYCYHCFCCCCCFPFLPIFFVAQKWEIHVDGILREMHNDSSSATHLTQMERKSTSSKLIT